jgi:hypothetical protein
MHIIVVEPRAGMPKFHTLHAQADRETFFGHAKRRPLIGEHPVAKLMTVTDQQAKARETAAAGARQIAALAGEQRRTNIAACMPMTEEDRKAVALEQIGIATA